MKLFTATTVLLGISCAHAHDKAEMDEIARINAAMGEYPKRQTYTSSGCPKKELDPYMLIAKYNMNISMPEHLEALSDAISGNLNLGSITQLLPEANDAARVGALAIDGLSGDTDFPFGDMKPLYTVGEINVCEENNGEVYVGVPDGMGSYLADDETVRVVVQSESYGPLYYESYPYFVNGNGASFTGSHVQYTDFDREGLSTFMEHGGAAEDIITGFGQVSTTYYNLAGELVGKRDPDGPTVYGAHFSNTDVDGNWAVISEPTEADWLMQSLCSAHLEEAHQWGEGIGVEDDMYLTNEEWITYEDGKEFVGISMHAMDLAEKVDYAVGSVTVSGFEKIVEINPQHTDYVMLAISGYNGAYSGGSAELAGRIAEYGTRPDGTEYVWPQNVCPFRIYVGMKGKMEDGSDAPEDDFLARNGLRYGKVYGFAIDMSETGPTEGMWRDAYHYPRDNGSKVEGKFVAINWMWDGEVKNFRHDGAWDFQLDPPGYEGTDMKFWNAAGYNGGGKKTEHISPDTTPGVTGFVQSSTAGYYGHIYIHGVTEALSMADTFPAEFDSTYYVYEGENDITGQIHLGGDGLTNIVEQCPGVEDATLNCDNDFSVKSTFEDIDGFEVIAAKEGLFAVIQEDSGNELGERMFLAKLEHDGKPIDYYFIAQSGGKYNSRMNGSVGIPAHSSGSGGSHEFSGIIDLSGMLLKTTDGRMRRTRQLKSGKAPKAPKAAKAAKKAKSDNMDESDPMDEPEPTEEPEPTDPDPTEEPTEDEEDEEMGESSFAIPAHDGAAKRAAEFMVPINEKLLVLGLQSHNLFAGPVGAFKADRGGQVLLYKPSI